MGGVHEERFEGLMYHQGASIIYERVEASNSCVRTLIFGSFHLLPFVKFFPAPFSLFDLAFYYLFSLLFGFLSPFVFPSFSLLFCTCLAHVVSSLTYPNLLGNKRLDCCCCTMT
jgi:hypothetical protein